MIVEQTDRASAALCAAVAAEIRGVRDMIEQLADLLVGDTRFATDYLDQFQMFDLMSQQADESANVLDRLAEGRTAEEAIARVRLTAIQDRLRAAITGK
jgi:hypothetical protein